MCTAGFGLRLAFIYILEVSNHSPSVIILQWVLEFTRRNQKTGPDWIWLNYSSLICLPSMARLLRKNSQRGPANQRQSPACGHRVPHSSVPAEGVQTLLGVQWKCDSDRQSGGPTPSQLKAVYLHTGWDKTALGLAEQQHWETDLGF